MNVQIMMYLHITLLNTEIEKMNRYTVHLTYIEVTKTPLRKQHAASFNLCKSQENCTYANNLLRHYTNIKKKMCA